MGHDLPKISIVTPSFNQGRYIERTIRSVLSQGYPDLEYIVMDGGSTDGTIKILERYQDMLTWVTEPDNGQSHAINKAMQMARGEVLAYINTDDLYAPGALFEVGRYFLNHPGANWLTGRCRIVGPTGEEIRRLVTRYKTFWLRLQAVDVLPVLNFISQPATFWTRSVLEAVGPFDEDLHYAMDYDYWLRVARRFRLHVLHVQLADFRIHPTSKAGASASAQFDASYGIVRKHVTSPVLLALHQVHSRATVAAYRILMARERKSATPP